jgi:hypothetical protein
MKSFYISLTKRKYLLIQSSVKFLGSHIENQIFILKFHELLQLV